MKKLILYIIFSFTFQMGNSQDFNSDFKSLFMNLPVSDSIEDIIKGKFGYSFEQKVETISSDHIKEFLLYYAKMPNHVMFNETPGGLVIQKTNFIDSTSKYDVYITLLFPNKEDQVFAFNTLISQFDQYSNKTKSSETVDKKGRPINQDATLECNSNGNPIKLIVSDQSEFLGSDIIFSSIDIFQA